MRVLRSAVAALLIASWAAPSAPALTGAPYVSFAAPPAHALRLVESKAAAPIFVSDNDWPGLLRAATDLQADFERVTGIRPTLTRAKGADAVAAADAVVIIGTVGRSALVDHLVRTGKLKVDEIRGQWESWVREVVDQPFPGVKRALVIAGSDKRGTTYGLYDLSEQMGVSPWYWWADVTPVRRDAVHVHAGRFVQGPPSVKYRGIFLNDEYPALTKWVGFKYGTAKVSENPPVPANIANYGREFHARLFECLLRLKANYLWPAMWNNAFNEDDPENPRLADEYGIVMGTSHQEPMLRAQKEWDRRYQQKVGSWNYAKHPDLLEAFWREGIRRNKDYESIVTMGLRGANDTEMAPGGPEANRKLLEHIVDVQRQILAEEIGRPPGTIPQLWCLYKEVLEFYEHGMRVPDDVTLLWAEDNWGNVRRLPTKDELGRAGGAGIYYHFDYHGGPRSYQWINTSPLPKIWEQMSLAKQYGADRIWIVNVGHWRGYEVPTEFFIDLGWDTSRWTHDNTDVFLERWAAREFGPEHARDIADIVAKYAKYNGRRKPEMLAPTTYSLVAYNEAESMLADWAAIEERAKALFERMPADKKDAFYHLVLFPTHASALVNRIYVAAGKNQLYAAQGRANAAAYAAETRRLFEEDLRLMDHYNDVYAGGRWKHFMDQTHMGYTSWRDPEKNSLDHIKLLEPTAPAAGALGVAVEESTAGWPGADGTPALPRFDSLNRQTHWIEVFNRGQSPLTYGVSASAPWIQVSATTGTLDAQNPQQRLHVAIDWSAAPKGKASGTVTVKSGETSVPVQVTVIQPSDVTRESVRGFVESAGYLAIEPENVTRTAPVGENRWQRIEDYGRTLSGMRAEAPAHAASAEPGRNAPVLEYDVYLFEGGQVEVTTVTSPTLNFVPTRGLRYAISFDNQPPQIITLVPQGYQAAHSNMDWEKVVADNARHSLSKHQLPPGRHTLKIWMVDPAVVVQKIVINTGGLKPSYLGPKESLRR